MKIAIQSTMVTFGATPITLLGLYETTSGALEVRAEAKQVLTVRGHPEASFITDQWRVEDKDALFTRDDFAEAVQEMRIMTPQRLLKIDNSLTRYNPSAKVEFDGFDANGKPLLRIDSGCENGHFAILAMCFMARRLAETEHVLGLSSTLDPFVNNGQGLRRGGRGSSRLSEELRTEVRRELDGVPLLHTGGLF